MNGREATSRAAFGQLLRSCRRASGLSQEELAERAGVGVRTICDLERGQRRTRPYQQTVGSLAAALGIQGPQLDEFVRLSRQPVVVSQAQVPDPQGTAEPGARQMTMPRELPAAVAGFTGRDSELATLDVLLDTAPAGSSPTMLIAAIGGTAGVGKTALAVHWAHRARELFPDGQLYVNLRGYDPGQPLTAGDALAGFLRALGVPGQDVPPSEDDRAARYRSLLAGRRMLVVLDNARDTGQVRPLLPGTPGSAAMVTSRDALTGLVARDGARRLDLDLLPLSDAVSLLRTLIGSRVDGEPEAAAALAAHCCRLPLALRIAAELAAARPGAALAGLAAELADQQQRLDLLEAGADPSTAVRAVFSWSLRHLNPDTARTFRLLGTHPGPDLDTQAAAALTGTSPAQVRRLLDQLARAHLIQPAGPGRHAMHDLLRDYARELSAEAASGQDEQGPALARLLDYYLQSAAAAMNLLYPAEQHQRPQLPSAVATPARLADPGSARAWLDAELACLVACIAHAATCGWPEHAMQLAATLFRYLDSGGHLTEAVTVHGYAASAARQAGDVAAEATALHSLAAAELRQRSDQRAATHLKQALALRRQAGDRRGEAATLGNLGVLAWWQGGYDQAARYYEQALTLARETEDRAVEGTSLCNLAAARMRLGQSEQAARHLRETLALAREIGDQATETYALMNLGDVNLRQANYELAAAYLRQGLALARDGGDMVSEAAMLSGLGEADLRQGRYQQAAGQLRQALTLARDGGARSTETDALNLLGEVALAIGDHGQARVQYISALALACRAGDTHLQARVHDGLARAYQAGRDLTQAQHHWHQALTLYTEIGAPEADQVRAQLVAAASAVGN